MGERVALRRVGSPTGKLVRRPESWEALLAASASVLDGAPATRVFTALGDEIDEVELVASGDVLYVSSGEGWRPAASSPLAGGSTPLPADGVCDAADAAAGVCLPPPLALRAEGKGVAGGTFVLWLVALLLALALWARSRKRGRGAAEGAPAEVGAKEERAAREEERLSEGVKEERLPEGVKEERLSEGVKEERLSEGVKEERLSEDAGESAASDAADELGGEAFAPPLEAPDDYAEPPPPLGDDPLLPPLPPAEDSLEPLPPLLEAPSIARTPPAEGEALRAGVPPRGADLSPADTPLLTVDGLRLPPPPKADVELDPATEILHFSFGGYLQVPKKVIRERHVKEAKKERKEGSVAELAPQASTFELQMGHEEGYAPTELVGGRISRSRMATAYHLSSFYCSPEMREAPTPEARASKALLAIKKFKATRALARWRGTDEYQNMRAWEFDWDYFDCRDVVISWYDSVDQHGLELRKKSRSLRYETQARYLERQFSLAVLVDPDSGERYPISEVDDDIQHIMRVMVWMERGIFERVVTIGFREVN
ncbi:hypothetical protein AB1Y20_012099 [Prymnesium parvum]|uniref:KHA domain-containing protein n=1 Tax=Prymnesium parvum TaxID=97485 RepID=A0AB34IN58_PRYPA